MRYLVAALLGATALAGISAQSATAADLPTKAYSPASVYNWTGFYVGLNAGYAWGTASGDNPSIVPSSGSAKVSGALLGGQLGYNWQTGPVVLGIETDLDWSGVKGSTSSGICGGTTCTVKNTWLGTTRARLGYANGRWLPYLTAGIGYGDIKASDTAATTNGSKTKVGFAGGGGLEAALAGNWSAKIEYLYVNLGSAAFACTGCGTTTVKLYENIARVGVNYRF